MNLSKACDAKLGAGSFFCLLKTYTGSVSHIGLVTVPQCQCILSIFPASVHQFYANLLVFVNINPFFYINDQFALVKSSINVRLLSVLADQDGCD